MKNPARIIQTTRRSFINVSHLGISYAVKLIVEIYYKNGRRMVRFRKVVRKRPRVNRGQGQILFMRRKSY